MTSQSGGPASGTAGGVLSGAYPNPQFATNGTTPILGTVSAILGANVALPTANTYVDVLTIPITIGTWIIYGCALLNNATSVTDLSVKLWDGATTLSSGGNRCYAGNIPLSVPASGVYVAVGPVSVRLAAAGDNANSTVLAALLTNAAGNTATYLYALRIA